MSSTLEPTTTMPKRQKLYVEVVIPRSRALNNLREQAPIIETRDPDFEDEDDDYVPSDPESDQTKSLRASTRTSYHHHPLDDQPESLTGGRVRSLRQRRTPLRAYTPKQRALGCGYYRPGLGRTVLSSSSGTTSEADTIEAKDDGHVSGGGANEAGPSGYRRSTCPSPERQGFETSRSRSGSSTGSDGMAALTAAIDFIENPEGILAVSGDNLEIVVASSSTTTPEDIVMEETKPEVEVNDEEEEYFVDTSKLTRSPEPQPEPVPVEEGEMDCSVCYESFPDICKRAEEEGKGGVHGHLAVYACDKDRCGALCCIKCMIQMANNNLQFRKEVICPICTRPADMVALRAQAIAFDPTSGDQDPIRLPLPPLPPPPPPPPVATPELREQYIDDVIEFHERRRPQQQYFVTARREYHDWVFARNPAAAEHRPDSLAWLADSAWEAFWYTRLGRPWRGLPPLRSNAPLRRRVNELDIDMPRPPPPPGHEERMQRRAARTAQNPANGVRAPVVDQDRDERIRALLADPVRLAEMANRYRQEMGDGPQRQRPLREPLPFPQAGRVGPAAGMPPFTAANVGRVRDRLTRAALDRLQREGLQAERAAVRVGLGDGARVGAGAGVRVELGAGAEAGAGAGAAGQDARVGVQMQVEAAVPDTPMQVQARADLALLNRPIHPPPDQAGLLVHGLGAAPHRLPHGQAIRLVGLDILLGDEIPAAPRRAILQTMLGLRTPEEADIVTHNLRIAFGLEPANGAAVPTPAEMARLRTLRMAWGQLNQGRQGILAAQGHQLPVAAFHPVLNQNGV